MKIRDAGIIHINNTLGYGGVEKIVYQLSKLANSSFRTVEVVSSGGEYADKIINEGIMHYTIPDLSSKNPVDMVKILKILTKLVKDNNINIIHCHHRMAVFYAKLIPGKHIIIYNNHTIYSDKALFSKIILKGINIIADGEMAKKNVTEFFGVKDSGIQIIYNAVDDYQGEYKCVKDILHDKEQGKFIVVNSARLHPQKGMNYFIDAAKILVNQKCNISFYIVGDGELKTELLKQVKINNLENHVHFLGYRSDIKNVLKQCDLLVLTSIYEGLPLTPMEAFSVKKCVVATDIDGTREVVQDGYNGILVETKNPQSIAEGIKKLYMDRDLMSKYSENAYKCFKNKFSLIQFSEKYMKYYSSLLEKI